MAVPALRIPLGLDTQGFEKNLNEAKSLSSTATNFLVKEFAKAQLKLVVKSDEFKPAIQNASKFAGEQFDKVKPQIQAFTQAATRETAEAGLKVAQVFASPAIKGSFQAFTAVGVPAAVGLAQSLAPLALRAFAVYEALHLVGEAVNAAREQIAAMVAVADKASNFNVSPQFLQLFEGESRKLKVTTEELDAALSNAFNATKEKSPIDVSKYEVAKERITDIELTLRVFNDQLAKTAGTQLQGLVLFRNAETQEQKIRAILTSMVELDKIGQHVASLEVGEKFFGSQFVDRIRQGKTSAEEILGSMKSLAASQDGIFPDYLVNRAKAVDDQLKLSEERLSRALKPAWDDLASVILSIKSTWADVVDLIARAVEFSNKIRIPNVPGFAFNDDLQAKREALDQVNDRISGRNVGVVDSAMRAANGGELPSFIVENLKKRASELRAEINNLTIPSGKAADTAPSRGVGAAPTLKKTGSDARDPFDAAVDAVEKRTATINADTAATFKNAAAQAGLRAEFQELTALKRADGGVTQTQIDAYERYRQTLSAGEALQAANIKLTKEQETAFLNSTHGIEQATKAYGEAQDQLQKINSASSQLGSALSTAFSDAIVEGKKFGDVVSSLLKTLEKAAINSLFSSIFNAPSTGGPSAFASFFGIGKNAEGTDNWSGGPTWVGEKGPEIVNLPRGAQVIPNHIATRGGGGNVSFGDTIINGSGLTEAQLSRAISAAQADTLRRVPGIAVGAVSSAQMRGV